MLKQHFFFTSLLKSIRDTVYFKQCNWSSTFSFYNKIYRCALNDRLKELELKLEHQDTQAFFLNLDINLWMESLLILYDKRYSCPFLKVKMFHIKINIPNNIFYSTYAGEKPISFNSTFLDFLPRVREMIPRKLCQGWNVWKEYSFL